MGKERRQARERASIILQVRSGAITAAEGAERLGISRKTYYKWERRALAAMVEALEDRGPGRLPPPVDPEKAALRRQTEELQAKLTVLEQTEQLRQLLAQSDKKTLEVAAMLILALTQFSVESWECRTEASGDGRPAWRRARPPAADPGRRKWSP